MELNDNNGNNVVDGGDINQNQGGNGNGDDSGIEDLQRLVNLATIVGDQNQARQHAVADRRGADEKVKTTHSTPLTPTMDQKSGPLQRGVF